MNFHDALKLIMPVKNSSLENEIVNHLDNLTKPKGSLGRLEEFALRYCLCRGNKQAGINKAHVYTFAGDHGITREKITPYPSEVTRQMVLNMVHGGAAVSVMCRKAGFGYTVVDMGVNYYFEEIPGLMRKKIKKGTNNSTEQPAMSRQECEQAVGAGYDIAMECNADLVGVGEMGIGNTSSASALYSLLLGKPASETTGTGAGSTGDLLQRKMNAVQKAVDLHQKEWDRTPFDALRRVGGFEIAGMSGMIIGCAAKRIPVAVDGFTASAAALVAMRMNQAIRDYLFFSHESSEKFHRDFFRHEGIRPILTLDMRLGEGTGAVLAMQLIVQALECYHAMATFSSAGVSEKIG